MKFNSEKKEQPIHRRNDSAWKSVACHFVWNWWQNYEVVHARGTWPGCVPHVTWSVAVDFTSCWVLHAISGVYSCWKCFHLKYWFGTRGIFARRFSGGALTVTLVGLRRGPTLRQHNDSLLDTTGEIGECCRVILATAAGVLSTDVFLTVVLATYRSVILLPMHTLTAVLMKKRTKAESWISRLIHFRCICKPVF